MMEECFSMKVVDCCCIGLRAKIKLNAMDEHIDVIDEW
jgi:hypothetical protein